MHPHLGFYRDSRGDLPTLAQLQVTRIATRTLTIMMVLSSTRRRVRATTTGGAHHRRHFSWSMAGETFRVEHILTTSKTGPATSGERQMPRLQTRSMMETYLPDLLQATTWRSINGD